VIKEWQRGGGAHGWIDKSRDGDVGSDVGRVGRSFGFIYKLNPLPM